MIQYQLISPQMAAIEVSKLSPNELAELACTYSALLLHDDGQDITGDKINKLITAAGVKIEPFWPKLFAKAVQGKDISTFFHSGAATAPAPVAATVAPVVVDVKKVEEKGKGKKEEKKPAPAPVEDDDGGDMGGLFG